MTQPEPVFQPRDPSSQPSLSCFLPQPPLPRALSCPSGSSPGPSDHHKYSGDPKGHLGGPVAISSCLAELMTVSKTHSLLLQISHPPCPCMRTLEREEGTDLRGQERGPGETTQAASDKERLGRICQDVVSGAEQGSLLIRHPCALRGQMTKSR